MRIFNLRRQPKFMVTAATTIALLSELGCVSAPASGTGSPSMTRAPFGSVDGQAVERDDAARVGRVGLGNGQNSLSAVIGDSNARGRMASGRWSM